VVELQQSPALSTDRQGSERPWFDRALLVVLALGILNAVYFLVVGIDNPVVDRFGFRQTQTGMTAYWMTQGSPLLRYDTPVMGAPWSIPFELPFYQWLVALLSLTGLSIDAAGRLVNFTFYLGCLGPIWSLNKRLGFDQRQFLIFATLFIFSPFYVFWSRTLMIESTALFFGLSWLALSFSYLQTGSWWRMGFAVAAGALGITTKSTTFVVFGLLIGGLASIKLMGAAPLRVLGLERRFNRSDAIKAAVCLAGCAIVLGIGIVWLKFSDETKQLNPLGELLDSEHLAQFNYGPFDLRWSKTLWEDAILRRALPELFGPLFIVVFACFGIALASRPHARLAMICALGAVIPLLFVANLHRVHNYYQYANGFFVIAIAALGCGALLQQKRLASSVALLSTLLVSQIWQFQTDYKPDIEKDHTANSRYATGQALRSIVPREEAILIFGNDWNSNILYYSQRKGIGIPNIIPLPLLKNILTDPEAYLGGMKLGAVVQCSTNSYGDLNAEVNAFVKNGMLIEKHGPCEIRKAPISGQQAKAPIRQATTRSPA